LINGGQELRDSLEISSLETLEALSELVSCLNVMETRRDEISEKVFSVLKETMGIAVSYSTVAGFKITKLSPSVVSQALG